MSADCPDLESLAPRHREQVVKMCPIHRAAFCEYYAKIEHTVEATDALLGMMKRGYCQIDCVMFNPSMRKCHCAACGANLIDGPAHPVTLLPCGHMIYCEMCADQLDVCAPCAWRGSPKASIMGTVRTFLS